MLYDPVPAADLWLADASVAACTSQARLLLSAPTGSGTSTQVPHILLDRGLLGDGEVVVLQPRRLAARLLATRVATERGGALGAEVGYQVGLEGQTSAATRSVAGPRARRPPRRLCA